MRTVLNSPTRNCKHNKCTYQYNVLNILIIFLILFNFFNRIVSELSIYSYTIQNKPNSYIIVKKDFYDLYNTMNPAKVPRGIYFCFIVRVHTSLI